MNETTKSVSVYARIFDKDVCIRNGLNSNDMELIFIYLRMKQSYFNQLARCKKEFLPGIRIIYLNEVYMGLGFESSKEGDYVGWVISDYNKNGDNFIDFGLMEKYNLDFINGYKGCYPILDFNVDGEIASVLKSIL